MKKVLAAVVAAAFSLSIAGTAMAVPAQVNQQHNQITKVQADQTKKKKSTKKKTAKKKQTAKKASKKQAA